jgi:hypothetical protein
MFEANQIENKHQTLLSFHKMPNGNNWMNQNFGG